MTPMTKKEFGRLLLPLLRTLAKEQDDINKKWRDSPNGDSYESNVVRGIGLNDHGDRILWLNSNLGPKKRKTLVALADALQAKYSQYGDFTPSQLRESPFIMYGSHGFDRRVVWSPSSPHHYPVAWWESGRITSIQDSRMDDLPLLISFLESRVNRSIYKPLIHEF